MRKPRSFIAAGSAAILFAATGLAGGKPPPPEGDIACAGEHPITGQFVNDAAQHGLKGVANRDDLLIGMLSYMREPREAAEAASGTVLFIKSPKGWRAVIPRHEEEEVGLYVAPSSHKVIVITQRRIGDPGQSFTVVRSEDGFTTSTCATLRFPRDLNQPTWNGEYLEVHDLDINKRGRGVLVGSAAIERTGEQPRALWFSYATRDDGRSWGPPRRLTKQQDAPQGTLVPASLVDAPALEADLRAFVTGPR
ncbi:hypothetical protein [Stigmatella aurantiaca]|uniref:Uncharacterized protein n=1 Tax=Stigmatella aurantiaca (strain DW4/3-1) TaxID=378806 RepID=Q094H1_STIAD|nr:hypothetical protein [Stigmatella aurantiaca]ADO68181.1 uncharacterized protein STAUR_0372 [Stigmatella aurantiaca DW4/3-1]EAU67092.1 hypothetical protein STIAU_2630 [Stigmatella aurantiaca DW4/3-1]